MAGAAQQRKAFLVGVVLPRRANPGSRISGSVVTNPDDIAQDPRLIVKRVTLSLPTDAAGRPILTDVFVDAGNGRQSASRGFSANLPADSSSLHLACGNTDAPVEANHLDFHLQPSTATIGKVSSRGYSMLPVESDSGVMAINGPYDGDSAKTQVTVNRSPAKVIAESSDAAYFAAGASTHKGRNHVVLKQDGRVVSFDMFEAQASISANRTMLKEHESAQFTVTVDGGSVPAK